MANREQYATCAGNWTLPAELPHSSEKVQVVYWITTILLAAAMLAGGAGQLLHTNRIVDVFTHLRYPLYFSYILGVWQILGVPAILIPKFGVLKEWAYAGLFFLYTGAAASHWRLGDPPVICLVPLAFALVAMVSWSLRPPSRKPQPAIAEPRKSSRSQAVFYWIATILVALVLISGGWWMMSNSRLSVDQNPLLGFPAYFWQLLGFWKILGGIAILVPRFRLIKEWAYAGIVFNMTGATAARVLTSDSTAHIIAPLVIFGITLLSWMLRPHSRSLYAASSAWIKQHLS